MTAEEFLEHLRAATEDDVLNALEQAYIELPITTPAAALELFNIMLDELTGEADRARAGDQAKLDFLLRRIEQRGDQRPKRRPDDDRGGDADRGDPD